MTDFPTIRLSQPEVDYLLGRLTEQTARRVLSAEDFDRIRIARSPILGARGAMRDAGLDVTTVDGWRLK